MAASAEPRTDPLLAGMPDALALMREIDTAASRPVVRYVCGPAGSGKTMLLAQLRESLQRSAITVVDTVPEVLGAGSALLVDDADTLDDDTLAHLAALAAESLRVPNRSTVIVAAQTRTADVRLHRLLVAMGGREVTLGPLDRDGVSARASTLGASTLPTALAARIVRATGGVRAAVDAVLREVISARHDATDPADHTDSVHHAPIADRVAAAATAHFRRLFTGCSEVEVAALALAELTVPLDPDTVRVAVGAHITHPQAVAAIDRARGTAAVMETGRSISLLPAAAMALRGSVGDRALAAMRAAAVTDLAERGDLTPAVVVAAAASGVRGRVLIVAAMEFAHLATTASAARTLWLAALSAGADPSEVAVPYAETCALTGDIVDAAAAADDAMHAEDPDVVRSAVRVAAAVAAARASASRTADLYRWLGPSRVGADAPLAMLAMTAVGDRAGAQAFAHAAADGPPTSTHARDRLVAEGLTRSLTGSAALAAGPLLRAASMSESRARAGPDSAEAIAALLCLHVGEPTAARAVIERALEPTALTEPVTRRRLTLLDAWETMMRGDLDGAAAAATVACTDRRDRLLAAAVTIGCARRRGDTGTLIRAWADAAPVLAESEADLFSLLPIGELWLAGARVGELSRVEHLVREGSAVLSALGDPPVWASAWHWFGVQSAILQDDPAALVPHAQALAAAAETSTYAAALATAGRAWLRVLQGAPDPVEVESAATLLERLGLPWDGARLAGEAALRASDTGTATVLLQVARRIGPPIGHRPAAGPAASAEAPVGGGALTEREAEVAHQVVLGLTHKEIGARLFISAKTVEHHVARIRRRVGATSRSEMLSILRAHGFGQEVTR